MARSNSSYKQIVKTTGILGGVQMLNILLGIVKQKAIAIFLGSTGLGLISTFQSIIDFVRSVSTLGIDTAGVKGIAENQHNKELQYYSISVFQWWVRLTSVFGALLCLIFCYPISLFAFESGDYALHIAILSVCVLFTSLASGQTSVLQATRNVSLMAKANLLGNVVGVIIALSLYFFLGADGIIPAFVSGGIVLFVFSCYYAKKLKIPRVELKADKAFNQGLAILKLGAFIVSVSIMETASTLVIKAFLIRTMGEDAGLAAIGMLQPAWTITLVYLSLVLKSMGTDFFPRLCSVSGSSSQIRRLVNEQVYIALLVAIPVVVITMLFSDYILYLLYTSEFIAGTPLLQWHIVGSFFKVLSWALAFVLLATNRGAYYLFTEIVYFVVYLGVSYFGFPILGLKSIGLAYLLAYVFYLLCIYLYIAKQYKFRWYIPNLKIIAIGSVFILAAVGIFHCFSGILRLGISLVLIVVVVCFSLYMFSKVFDLKTLYRELKARIYHKK